MSEHHDQQTAPLTWQTGEGEHHLPIPGTEYLIAVYRTVPGDYALSCRHEDDYEGGDLDFFPTLAGAKRAAEQAVASGEWRDLRSQWRQDTDTHTLN